MLPIVSLAGRYAVPGISVKYNNRYMKFQNRNDLSYSYAKIAVSAVAGQ
jgi:hypothetical protein